MNRFWSANRVRAAFLEYFIREKDHVYVPSSSVVPHNDPMLLFVNAGMNQFKPIFQGTACANLPQLKRVANTQKCIRAGGKHNDLDDVGKDVCHHTFFEMLGNWSFGDYFKEEICSWAWHFLTARMGISADRLYVSYFGGDDGLRLASDEECRRIWLDVGVPSSHVLSFGIRHNFWEMDDVGPCGPCSEIHYDCVGGRDASLLVNAGDPTVVEVWNLVFMEFNRGESGRLLPLPRKHIDCGLGFERFVSIMQNKTSSYDTDVFEPIFDTIRRVTGARSYTGNVGTTDRDGVDMAYRLIADHSRALTIALSDGATPSNVGRGHVVRRLIRRGVRQAAEKLGARPGQFSQFVPAVVDSLGEIFPELMRNPGKIMGTIDAEEAQFLRILATGRKLFDKYAAQLPASSSQFPGELAYKLHDTHGVPVDLTVIMAEERGFSVDLVEYWKCKEAQVAASRSTAKKSRKY